MQYLNLLLFFIHLCIYLTWYDDNIIVIIVLTQITHKAHRDNNLIKTTTKKS